MADSRKPMLDRCDPVRVLSFLLRTRTRWVICWLVALASAGVAARLAWIGFNQPERRDGNWGHCSIDFGGQWLAGRMIVEGHGRQLYNRPYLRRVAEENYPADAKNPNTKETDAENLLLWMTGKDDDEAIGGSLYPPIHALLFAPLATFPPPIAYRIAQALVLAMVFLCGWLVQRLTEGRVWWPVASVFLMLFPGFGGAINLGQNAMFSLAVLLLGWRQLARGRPALAGICWGLLAFKPVWAASFFLVPLLTRRWRMAASMAATGLVQIAITLPVVGGQSWPNWLHVSRLGADDYTVQENWIFLSRDLLGIPRRWLLTFEAGIASKPEEQLLPTLLGWGLWTAVLAVTLLVVWRRQRKMNALDGPPAAFVLMGAIFACYHFMYYDFLLAGLPVCLLFTEPRRYLQIAFWRRPRWLTGQCRMQNAECRIKDNSSFNSAFCLLPSAFGSCVPPLLFFLILVLPAIGYLCDPTSHFPPGETFGLLLLWAWCGYQVWTGAEEIAAVPARGGVIPALRPAVVALDGANRAAQLAELGADVGRAHERLADQHSADAGRL